VNKENQEVLCGLAEDSWPIAIQKHTESSQRPATYVVEKKEVKHTFIDVIPGLLVLFLIVVFFIAVETTNEDKRFKERGLEIKRELLLLNERVLLLQKKIEQNHISNWIQNDPGTLEVTDEYPMLYETPGGWIEFKTTKEKK
jgi:hypothetical protein